MSPGEVRGFVHPSAIVEPGARLGAGVRIGPFCHIGSAAALGDGVEVISHVSIAGATTIGAVTSQTCRRRRAVVSETQRMDAAFRAATRIARRKRTTFDRSCHSG